MYDWVTTFIYHFRNALFPYPYQTLLGNSAMKPNIRQLPYDLWLFVKCHGLDDQKSKSTLN